MRGDLFPGKSFSGWLLVPPKSIFETGSISTALAFFATMLTGRFWREQLTANPFETGEKAAQEHITEPVYGQFGRLQLQIWWGELPAGISERTVEDEKDRKKNSSALAQMDRETTGAAGHYR